MTQEEHDMLADLAKKIAQTPSPARDADAEDFIRKNIGSRPDALYLMTQTVLIQNMAIQQAQRQIQDLQQRSQQPVPAGNPGGSFLGQGSGRPQYTDRSQYSQQYQPSQPQYAPQQSVPPPPATAAPPPSAMSGFLRGAAQTAAGVAAGTLAVQGIESLFSHHGGGGGLFGGGGFGGEGFGGGMGGYTPGETVIENNYYGDPAGGGGGERFADNASDNTSDDYRGDGSLQPQDADFDDSNTQADDASSFDDTSNSDDSFA